ncbi:MAG: nucleotide exchange factor GrpE [Cyclonatronaceae bacterium]
MKDHTGEETNTAERETDSTETQPEAIENEIRTDESIDPKDEIIANLIAQIDQKNDQLLRKVAEFENMRKRVQNERMKLFEDARIDALQQFLPVNDDLQRTVLALKETGMDEKYLKGIELVANKMANTLNQYGIEIINQVNVPFDVNLHDALMRQKPEDKNTGSDIVLQVLEDGYKIGDRVIRHAKVIVSE